MSKFQRALAEALAVLKPHDLLRGLECSKLPEIPDDLLNKRPFASLFAEDEAYLLYEPYILPTFLSDEINFKSCKLKEVEAMAAEDLEVAHARVKAAEIFESRAAQERESSQTARSRLRLDIMRVEASAAEQAQFQRERKWSLNERERSLNLESEGLAREKATVRELVQNVETHAASQLMISEANTLSAEGEAGLLAATLDTLQASLQARSVLADESETRVGQLVLELREAGETSHRLAVEAKVAEERWNRDNIMAMAELQAAKDREVLVSMEAKRLSENLDTASVIGGEAEARVEQLTLELASVHEASARATEAEARWAHLQLAHAQETATAELQTAHTPIELSDLRAARLSEDLENTRALAVQAGATVQCLTSELGQAHETAIRQNETALKLHSDNQRIALAHDGTTLKLRSACHRTTVVETEHSCLSEALHASHVANTSLENQLMRAKGTVSELEARFDWQCRSAEADACALQERMIWLEGRVASELQHAGLQSETPEFHTVRHRSFELESNRLAEALDAGRATQASMQDQLGCLEATQLELESMPDLHRRAAEADADAVQARVKGAEQRLLGELKDARLELETKDLQIVSHRVAEFETKRLADALIESHVANRSLQANLGRVEAVKWALEDTLDSQRREPHAELEAEQARGRSTEKHILSSTERHILSELQDARFQSEELTKNMELLEQGTHCSVRTARPCINPQSPPLHTVSSFSASSYVPALKLETLSMNEAQEGGLASASQELAHAYDDVTSELEPAVEPQSDFDAPASNMLTPRQTGYVAAFLFQLLEAIMGPGFAENSNRCCGRVAFPVW